MGGIIRGVGGNSGQEDGRELFMSINQKKVHSQSTHSLFSFILPLNSPQREIVLYNNLKCYSYNSFLIQKRPCNINSSQCLISHQLKSPGTKIQIKGFTSRTSIHYNHVHSHIALLSLSFSGGADFTVTERIVVWICGFLGRVYFVTQHPH